MKKVTKFNSWDEFAEYAKKVYPRYKIKRNWIKHLINITDNNENAQIHDELCVGTPGVYCIQWEFNENGDRLHSGVSCIDCLYTHIDEVRSWFDID